MTDGRRTTKWGRLSDDAQNVLEHLIGMSDTVLHTIEIEVGQHPKFSSGRRLGIKPLEVSQKLFGEMKAYAESESGEYATLEIGESRMVLRLKDDVLAPQGRGPGL